MRVALVTGAARGIGAATVDLLCRQGYGVTALDLCSGTDVPAGVAYPLATPAELAAVAARWPDQVLPVEADVRDVEALRLAVAATIDRFGGIDAAVACAGVVVGGLPQWQTPGEHLATLLDINMHGVWNTAAAVVPALLVSRHPAAGRFVAVASAAGDRGLFHLAGYSVSKHAVIGLVRGLAADLVGSGVTAVAVSPGSTDTAMVAATADLYGTTPAELAAHQHLRRLLTPAEIAATIALCCSAEGAALNGSVVHADGGFRG
jgi:SDR family mycofactocin-dependent oxidoreductase